MQALSFLFVLVLAGCASSPSTDRMVERYGARLDSQDRGDLLFSIKGTRPGKGLWGNFYFVDRSGKDVYPLRPVVMGYVVEDGRLKQVFGPWDYEKMASEFKAVGFESFDLAAEIETIEKKDQTSFMAFHGADLEITFEFSGQRFVSRRSRILAWVDQFAPRSTKIAKLKSVIDIFATYHGREMLPGR
jgi:hypothetical protein